jgi:uncharacterized membrane protein
MVDAGETIKSMIPKVSGTQIINGLLITLVVLIVMGTIAFFLWKWIVKRKYNEYRIIIYEKDATGNVHEYYDRGGIFTDNKTGFKLLFLEKIKKGLNPNNPPYTIAKDRKGRLVKTIYLRRVGVSNFRFIKMTLSDEGMSFTVGEEDANWYQHEMEKIDRMTGKSNMWAQLAPIITVILAMVILLIVVIVLFNKLEVFSQAASSLAESSKVQLEISQTLQNMTIGKTGGSTPIIIPGGTPR